jgi:hypothetical protein
MRAKRAAHDFFIAQTPFSKTAQKKADDPSITRFEFPIDSHDFSFFRITHIIPSCQHFFRIFSQFILKIFYPKNIWFIRADLERKIPLFFLSKKAKSPAR